MNRYAKQAIPGLGVLLIFSSARGVVFGMDDYTIFLRFPGIGSGAMGFLTLFQPWIVHRFMPLGWLPLLFVDGANGMHALTLCLSVCWVGSLSVWIYRRSGDLGLAWLCVWAWSAAMWEVFGWSICYLYVIVGCLSWLLYYFPRAGYGVGFAALCVYPQSGGAALYRACRDGKGWWFVLLVFASVQYALRFSGPKWPYDFGRWFWVLPAYALECVFPVTTVPINDLRLGWPVIVGAFMFGAAAGTVGVSERWLTALCPTILAAVTEPFWFAARYSLVPALLLSIGLASMRKGRTWLVWLLAGTSAAYACSDGAYRSVGGMVDRTRFESAMMIERAALDVVLLRRQSAK